MGNVQCRDGSARAVDQCGSIFRTGLSVEHGALSQYRDRYGFGKEDLLGGCRQFPDKSDTVQQADQGDGSGMGNNYGECRTGSIGHRLEYEDGETGYECKVLRLCLWTVEGA